MVNANKNGFINLVLQNVAVSCFAITTAKCHVQRTAHHVLKSAKTGALIAIATTNVDSHVQNATNLASGSASIGNAPSYVVRCVTGLAVTSHV